MHGLLVGVGIERKDGSRDFKWLEKPIHNRIVSGGLDAYFQFNGSNNTTSSSIAFVNRFLGYYSSDSSKKYGVLRYFAVGTNGSETGFNDTGLKAQVGGYSNSWTYTESPYIGFRRNDDDSASIRLQSTSVSMPEAATIRELGWFEKYDGVETYVMFSRVVLDTPISLNAGDKLTACYQLNLTFSNMAETAVNPSLLTGLLDSDGNALRATQKFNVLAYDNVTKGTWYNPGSIAVNFPAIAYYSRMGGNYPNASVNGWLFFAPFYKSGVDAASCLGYNTNAGFTKYSQWARANNQATTVFNTTGYNYDSYTVLDYVPGTYQRDRKCVLAPTWPNQISGYQDVYAVCFGDLAMYFGYYDENNTWHAKPWRKEFGKRYEFTYRLKLSTEDTP